MVKKSMAKQSKQFKTPAEQFLSTSSENETVTNNDNSNSIENEIVFEFRMPSSTEIREKKDTRVQLLMRKTTKEAIQEEASKQGTSFNALVNKLLDQYAERIKND